MKKAKGINQVSKKNNKKFNYKLLLFIIVPLIIISSSLAFIYTNSDEYKLIKKGYDSETIKIIKEKELTKNALKYDNPKEFSLFSKKDNFKVSNINIYKSLSNYIEKFDVVSFVNKIIELERYNENHLINYADKYSGEIEEIENIVKDENKIIELEKLKKYFLKNGFKEIGQEKNPDIFGAYEKEIYVEGFVKQTISISPTVGRNLMISDTQEWIKDGGTTSFKFMTHKDEITYANYDSSYHILYQKNYITLDTSCTATPVYLNCDSMPTLAANFRDEWLNIFKTINMDIEILRQ